jgi:spore coat polysaccharide biosynthesis protein SpsF
MKTDQEIFWKGDFGNNYIERNHNEELIASSTSLFSSILNSTDGDVASVIEFGCNVGINLASLKRLLPNSSVTGLEINSSAASVARELKGVEVIESSILEFNSDRAYDLTFSKGVLIHINPDHLTDVYKSLYDCSNKYIMIAEYYNPSPVSIDYRGYKDRLFKRDFAGEMMDIYSDLELVNYGFVYHRDTVFPQDDISWFLMKKKSS